MLTGRIVWPYECLCPNNVEHLSTDDKSTYVGWNKNTVLMQLRVAPRWTRKIWCHLEIVSQFLATDSICNWVIETRVLIPGLVNNCTLIAESLGRPVLFLRWRWDLLSFFCLLPVGNPLMYWFSRRMTLWGSISFNLAVFINIIIALFYPYVEASSMGKHSVIFMLTFIQLLLVLTDAFVRTFQ